MANQAQSPSVHHKTVNPLAAKLQLRLDPDQLTNCMRCGFCLPACPTFAETGIEAESPRGRIALMKAVADGIMEPDRAFEEQMNHCLGCRACEPACPADVKYGRLLEQARDAIEDHTERHSIGVKLSRHAAFKKLFPNQKRMKLIGRSLQWYQQSGLQKFARQSGAMKLFPKHMQAMEKILPEASGQGIVEQIGTRHPAKGERIATVALFRGCLMDVLFTSTNRHTVDLLTEAGFEVVIPEEQNCCGALHAHSGEAEMARSLARQNVQVFKDAGVEFIVSNAGGCGALLVEYDHLLHEDPTWKEDASWFAAHVIDISELLVRHGRLPEFHNEDVSIRITYQDSCHLRNVMRTSDAPRQLMKQVKGVTYAEMKDADRCCGSAGIYNLTQPEMAGQILDHKMEHVRDTQAQVLLTSNPGCLLQMKHGIEQHGLRDQMQAVHIVDFLHDHMHPSRK
ncbi:glycolate oxidase [Paenibacillus selenitireducens]|uniref:Glycolate oxidase iron-sulfur subunit n=1 Tax=Paenibacillus selenitireducens TaxID=1324314 RepID=A0A1T2XAD4_9BACL|nr:glycolate oxidase [Paenibacillus selenitireducens]